ncbi:MAG: thioredoxin family protein [Cyclobacteriaceae bacterium]|nr:thioredoxin family protein [Cyclobacteriaceae bacterium]MCH8517309.1 thioredoxin family protein [Cyclobacteriaceae bacterium]
MKASIFVLIIILMSLNGTAQIKKYNKWDKAAKVAQEEGKDILIILTGKQWCAPCKKLENNVLSTKDFERYAQDSFLVFEIDLPKSHIKKPNSKISQLIDTYSTRYDAKAFPSLILVDLEGTEKMKITESNWSLEEVVQSLDTVYTKQ